MMDKIDKVFWVLTYLFAMGSWISIQFFDWMPDPKHLAAIAFIALQFAASSKLDLFRKADRVK